MNIKQPFTIAHNEFLKIEKDGTVLKQCFASSFEIGKIEIAKNGSYRESDVFDVLINFIKTNLPENKKVQHLCGLSMSAKCRWYGRLSNLSEVCELLKISKIFCKN